MINFKETNIIGLTGMSGSGKTTACDVFGQRGFYVINCDIEAREIISRRPCVDAVKRVFPEVIAKEELIDRPRLTELIFSSREKLKLYNSTVFPYVIYGITNKITQAAQRESDILLDAPTLYHSGADDFCRKVVAVIADRETSMRRIVQRDGLTAKEAFMRLANQPDEYFFREKADYIIENNGDLKQLIKSINKVIDEIKNGT